MQPATSRRRLKGATRIIMEPDAKIYVAGHQGLVGSAIWRRLQAAGFKNLVVRSLQELDLRDQAAVTDFFGRERPEYVFLAGRPGGGDQGQRHLSGGVYLRQPDD